MKSKSVSLYKFIRFNKELVYIIIIKHWTIESKIKNESFSFFFLRIIDLNKDIRPSYVILCVINHVLPFDLLPI